MIVEIARLKAKPGAGESLRGGLRAARAVIAQAAGYRGSVFHRGIEEPDSFLLRIEWETLEAHTAGFRQSRLFPEWRSHFADFLDGAPDVRHYEVFAEE
ncbi:MAG TPA: antibiotic biosynthesis monooxygenase [Polyangiaceae bacterium]|nr:antibiotic biosynthesis monooxygenase [Polyangiaceae bacterium]